MDEDRSLSRDDAEACGVASPASPRALSATCSVMSVTYVPRMAPFEHHRTSDAIQILVAADQPVFHAIYRPADVDCATVQQTVPASCREHADMVIISVDRAFFQNKARVALGNSVSMTLDHYCAADPLVKELGNALLRDFRAHRTPAATYLESLAGVIAVHLAANHCGSPVRAVVRARGLPRHKLQRVLSFISEHIDAALHVAELSATAHMSLHHFARMFKEATGVAPHHYVTLQRIDRAKSLLSGTDHALVDVASEVGFQTQGHFTSVFRKHTGLTPRKFRVAWQSEVLPGQTADCS
jgi:AraC family transcriptional regulator